MEILLRNVLDTAKYDPTLAEKQAMLIRRISMRYRIRLPYEVRQLFCKRCKRLIIPGVTSRVRIGRSSIRAIRITCLHCNHIYRKIIDSKQG
ncbi:MULTISPECIES: ribonuclease P protein component 4 [Candidatus Nitrosocaldus]|uniref:Ribonuclease P protein component 4 n=1 Tax=Candidatus Nitrosocaldus cavascurensis TaxID=2058097 RepID=A0A2K5AT70_9ARCH|nr:MULTISPECIES: RNase P subunit [Candidatus Nitrosocaldus]SPC34840.1 Ribonuclease P protein component 4 [Candidatus Nitrosocaldus cavascurensis]